MKYPTLPKELGGGNICVTNKFEWISNKFSEKIKYLFDNNINCKNTFGGNLEDGTPVDVTGLKEIIDDSFVYNDPEIKNLLSSIPGVEFFPGASKILRRFSTDFPSKRGSTIWEHPGDSSELWHTDGAERHNTFKIFIYLSDVLKFEDGPFEYKIPIEQPSSTGGRYSYSDFGESVYCKAGTSIIFKTDIIHKGNYVRNGYRDTITLGYRLTDYTENGYPIQKNGILFNVRLGSKRLPEKHLYQLNFSTTEKKSILELQLLRFYNEFRQEIENKELILIIASTTNPENRKLEEIAKKCNVELFFGSDINIPFRHLQIAEKYDLKNIISVDGDDLTCSVSSSRDIYERFKNNEGESFRTEGLPLGMNVLVSYTRNFLSEKIKELQINENKELDTGWGIVVMGDSIIVPRNLSVPLLLFNKLRLTIDYIEDVNFYNVVLEFLGTSFLTVGDEELIRLVITNEWFLINSSRNDDFWSNFEHTKNKLDSV